ncbi:MAG: transcription termination factor Rho, partial [Anaerolineae bacterium]|nr:transcription termination factor Rho [Anaerolineae bacterium]
MADRVRGLFRKGGSGAGTLYDPEQPRAEIRVPAQLVREHGLVEGAAVMGEARDAKGGVELISVETLCGLPPEGFKNRMPFDSLVPISANERFPLGKSDEPAMRIIDLVAPIGKGTRGLIVSPPKAGKTMLLEQLAQAIRAGDPDVRIVMLLVDERPEEVTFFRRAVDAEVFASSSDRPMREHVGLSELMMAHIRTELE